MRAAIIIGLIVGALFFAGGVVMTALAIKYATNSILWDAILWGGVAIMCASIATLTLYISGQISGRPILGPALLINLAICAATLGLVWHFSIDAVDKPHKPESSSETDRLVSQAQFGKVAELEKFFGGKDENDLRQLFDLHNILLKNINVQITRIGFIKAGREKDFLYSDYTDNGNWIAWVKEGHYSTGPSGVHVEAGPKDVLYLVTTAKFQTAQKKLVDFMNSALIPGSIKKEVVSFNDTINKDTELMMRILDEKMHEDENYFLHNMNMGTPYYGVIVSAFATRVIQLKPTADRVLSAISDSWKISK